MGFVDDFLQGIPVNAVLRERVALVEQKFQASERQISELTESVARLEADNRALKEKLAEFQAKDTGELAADEVLVLEAVGQYGGSHVTIGQVVQKVQFSPQKTRYYLEELTQKEYLYDSLRVGQPPEFSLNQRGRKYLIKTGKI